MSERGGISLPGSPAQVPGLPENFAPVLFEQFATLNTKALRPGIKDEEMAWCDGIMPIGPNNARVLWGTGTEIFSDSTGIEWFGFGNISTTNYCYALLSDGSLWAINMQTLAEIEIMVPGTINNPRSVFGFSQWGSKYAIFAEDQTNGYWLWDGTNLFGAGTMGPEVSITNGGQNYTSAPSYSVITTGSGTGIGLSFQLQNGAVSQVTVTNPASGFGRNDFTAVYLVGGGTDSSAVPGVNIAKNSGGLAEVYVISAGSGYTGFAFAVVNPGGTGGHGATISLSIQNGSITGAAIVTPGQGYREAPGIGIFDPGIPGSGGSSIPGGTGGAIGCTIAYGQITGIAVMQSGSGYVSPPTVTIVGDGTGASALATVDGGGVSGFVMTHMGQGYTKAVALLTGGNDGASITVQAMPFGISGTAVEVYQNHVWVTNGAARAAFPPQNRTIFSDPSTPVGFGNGGGAFASSDAFLRIGYHALKQTNGFLYLIGDSSMNYISGVQTSSSGSGSVAAIPVTTFGNLNVDPQIGTPWPGSVQVFSRNIVFANTVGIHVSYGGAIKKVSDPLDGFYATGNIFGQTANFTSAVAHIFAIPVYMLLLPVVDPFTGQPRHKLLMWDGKKWFTAQQDRTLQFIATYEQNSVLTAYGSDGESIFPLFAQPTTAFKKTLQSKLFASPAYFTTKQSRSLSGILNYYDTDGTTTVSIDSEAGLGTGNALIPITETGLVLWMNNAGGSVSWTNNSSQAVTWGGLNLTVFGPYPTGQQGRLIGLTLQTTASDLAILSLMLADMVESPNV